MQLLKMELRGFKSFADKTTLTFDKGITAIVGPNGSGKSNISDAVRWVMGEQNVRQLRGQKSEDIIFAGTQTRRPQGAAEVSLYFDNSDHALDTEFTEVVVTRRLFRSGDSEYYINRRTDDIEEILRHSMRNKEFFLLLELQKSLTYFTSALRSNGIVMERLMRLRRNTSLHHLIKMYEEDEDLLEDVIIENKQAIEMVEMYSNILMNMSDTFASIISNNLNLVMKFLASITIMLAVPTIIFSLWGINVPVPFQDTAAGFYYVVGIAMCCTIVAVIMLWRKDLF